MKAGLCLLEATCISCCISICTLLLCYSMLLVPTISTDPSYKFSLFFGATTSPEVHFPTLQRKVSFSNLPSIEMLLHMQNDISATCL